MSITSGTDGLHAVGHLVLGDAGGDFGVAEPRRARMSIQVEQRIERCRGGRRGSMPGGFAA